MVVILEFCAEMNISGNIFYFSHKITLNKSRLTLLQLLILFSCFKKFFFKLKKKNKQTRIHCYKLKVRERKEMLIV